MSATAQGAQQDSDRKVALVTGGGRGIGRAVALRLAREGFDIAITWTRDESAAKSTVADIAELGRRGSAYQADVADYDDDVSLTNAIMADFGQLDALVSNAGIASRGLSVVDTQPKEIERVLAVHAKAAFYLCSLLAPHLRERPRGDIVLMSSNITVNAGPNTAPYAMGKAALEMLARVLAKEEAPYGTRVNVVAPGLTVTDMGDRLAHAVTGVDGAAELDATWPFGRVTRPEDIAEAVWFLLSPAAAQITGQRIGVDGGESPMRSK